MLAKTIKSILLFAFCVLASFPLWAQSYPDASNTGWKHTGVTLKPYTGPTTITVDGTVIDGRDVKSCLTIKADNVVIRRSRIAANCIFPIRLEGAANLLVEDSEISCEGNFTGIHAMTSDSYYTGRRIYGHDCENVISIADKSLLEDSFIHEPCPDSTDAHTDSIQLWNDDSNMIIRHNRVYAYCSKTGQAQNSAITGGYGLSNLLIEDNILAGGGYTLRLSEKGTLGANVKVRNNKFSTIFFEKSGSYGPIRLGDTPDQLCGNTWYDGPNAGQMIAYSSNKACADEITLPPPGNLSVIP